MFNKQWSVNSDFVFVGHGTRLTKTNLGIADLKYEMVSGGFAATHHFILQFSNPQDLDIIEKISVEL